MATSSQSVNLNVNTQQAEQDIADLGKTINDFLSQKGQASGKKVKLFDLSANKAEIEEILKLWKEVINLNSSIRGPMNMAGQGAGHRPALPSQMTAMPGESAKDLEKRITLGVGALLNRYYNTAANPTPNGLTPQDMRPGPSNRHPKHDQFFTGSSAVGHVARQVSPLLGGAGGAIGQAASIGAEGFAGRGLAGFAGGGMAGLAAGAGIGLLGYGAYKAASAVNEGVDREKVLATDIDKFRRSIGITAESFDKLVDHSRSIGDEFNLLYSESRKISTEFANIAKTNVGALDQASEGVGLAQAVGVDESQGSGLMAQLRKDQSIGEKKSDARLFAIQFAEALKRTGSTLNASELMTAIQSFSGDAAHRGLSVANTEGYAGVLSAMVGMRIPGMDVGNAAGILGRADAAFREGGGGGQAGQNLLFQALDGPNVGLMGVEMRLAAGLLSTADGVYGGKNNPVNMYANSRGQPGMEMHTGSTSAIEDIVKTIQDKRNSGDDTTLEIRTLSALLLRKDPNAAATLLLSADKGNLSDTIGLMRRSGVKPEDLSNYGFEAFASIADAKGDTGKLREVEAGLGKRADLSKDQQAQLAAMKGMDGPKLQEALVKFATTLAREKTEGEQIAKAAVDTSNNIDLIAKGLIPASIMTNNLLSEIVKWFAPNSPYLKEIEQQNIRGRAAISPQDIKSGKVTNDVIQATNLDHIIKLRDAYEKDKEQTVKPRGGVPSNSRMAVLENYYRQMGDKMVVPVDIADSFNKGEIEAMKKRVDAENKQGGAGGPATRNTAASGASDGMKEAYDYMRKKGWSHEQASGIVANLEAESGKALDPTTKEGGGGPGMGIAQWGKTRQKDFREWSGSGGKNIWEVSREKQLEFLNYEMTEGKEKANGDRLRMTKTAGDAGEVVSRYVERPLDKDGAAAARRRRADELAGTLGKIPANDPGKAAAAAAEAQRLHVSVGEQKTAVTVNLVPAPGTGQQPQTVTASGTSKATAAGSVKTSSPMRYKA